MSTSTTFEAEASCLLRTALRGNAAFSALSGAVLIAAAGPLAALMGIAVSAILPPIGVILALYAGGLWWSARRPQVSRTEARIAVAMDVAWVVLSAALLLLAPLLLTPAGRWIVAAVAVCVAAFAVLQALGLRALDRG